MALTVAVRRASHLPNVDRTGKSDPYAVVAFRGQERKTKYVKDSLEPQWKEVFKFTLVPNRLTPEDLLEVRVYDHEFIGKSRLLGLAKISLSEFEVATGREWTAESSYPLQDEQGCITEATIYVFLSYQPPSDQTGEYVAEDTLEHPEGYEVETNGVGPLKQHEKGPHSKSVQESTFGTSRGRMNFPDRRLDFQVLVHIFEARRLMGNNLKPMVRVTCGSVIQSTGIRRGTENPYWDETLVFAFKEKAQQLFEQQLKIEVLNSGAIFNIQVLGQFTLDIGWVFDEPEHSITNKWLLLTASDEASMSVKGYLKVSVTVVPPGGTAKPFRSLSTSGSDSIDNEANLLRPLGARLQPATLSITVYHADDLPQMDSEMFEKLKSILPGMEKSPKYNLVDPYVTVSFAGHSQHTSTVHENRNPVWDTKLNLAVRFPSMCNTIKIQMLDHDTITNEVIGTAFLEIPQISVFSDSALGFPPTFGPAFVNVYGSQREFSVLPSKYKLMDKGKVEGVAYRGRIMVKVEMTLGSSPAVPRELLGTLDKEKSMPYLQRRTYKLCATFLNATMISPDDGPVEFEVSIGNYGNKLDNTTPDILSTTSPLHPVHDGSCYHYLPWFDSKPSVVVDSRWEDNTYRMASLNILINIQRELRDNLSRCRRIIEQPDYSEADLKVQVKETLASLSASLKAPLPTLPKQTLSQHNLNKLDVQLRKWREASMEELLSRVHELQQAKKRKPGLLLEDVEEVLQQLSQMIFEPQISVPDVIIWMMSGAKRLASARLPAHRLMYIPPERWKGCLPGQGDLCGKAQDIMLTSPSLHPSDDPNELDARAKLHMVLWLGLASDAEHSNVWSTDIIGVQPAVYAETYENQAKVHGSWGSVGLSGYEYSDAQGKLSLPKAEFTVPEGWAWEGEWFVRISEGAAISGPLQEVVELIEHQTRDPGSGFKAAEQHWTDKHGEEINISSKEELETREHWEWSQEWEVEGAGVEDKDGWQYGVEEEDKSWSPNMRNTHLFRRRTLVRRMVKQRDQKPHLSIRTSESPGRDEGWEYARKPHLPYHPEPGKMCMARRRRWLRKLEPRSKQAEVSEKRPTFQFVSKKSFKSATRYVVHPLMYVMYPEDSAHQYQLRAYVYLAKDMHSSDSSGLADPYAKVSFVNRSQETRVQKKTISPIWNQTVVLSDVVLFGDPGSAHKFTPPVTVEFFDRDWIGKDTYMGNIQVLPDVCLDGRCPEHPELQWLKIQRNGQPAGELLATFILFLTDGVMLPEPCDPAPEMQTTVIDTLLWGVTLTKKYHDLIPINHVLVELDCAGATKRMKSPAQIAKKRLNFPQPGLSLTVSMPKNPHYASPLNIKLLDERLFGWTSVVGTSVVSLGPYLSDGQDKLESLAKILDVKSRVKAVPTGTSEYLAPAGFVMDEPFDWWSKFYTSLQDPELKQEEYDKLQLDKLVIYDGPLEDYFSGNFGDVLTSYKLYDGSGKPGGGMGKASEPVGTMKAIIGAYPALSSDGQPPVQSIAERVLAMPPIECVVRVYIIRAHNLMPRDQSGKSDPYIHIELGSTVIKDSKSYVPNELNPVFGRMYELKATLPTDSLLKVSVMDYDFISADDLIGETTIDLENRYLSKQRALCGLPETFSVHGCNRWRDNQSPVAILDEYCVMWGLGEPVWDGNSKVKVGEDSYNLHTFERQGGHSHANLGQEQQRLALHILRDKGLVPEHVESRPLLSPAHDSEQGRLQMWVDIFPRHLGPLPSPVDITPRKPQSYVLRMVVYDAVNTASGALCSCSDDVADMYVKCWMQGEETPQKTEVHYRCFSGEGNFNWRFVFPFEFLPQEKVMVVRKKEHFFSLDETEKKLPPRLTVQLWDSEFIGPNEYLGMIELDLLNMIPRSKFSRLSSLRQLTASTVNLFEYKKLRGWWPVAKQQGGKKVLAGKLDLELELLTEREAQERPAGKGREEPNAHPFLPEPKHLGTSFLWVTSPWKTVQFMVWRRFKQWVLCPFALCCLCCCFIFFFIILIVAVSAGVNSAISGMGSGNQTR